MNNNSVKRRSGPDSIETLNEISKRCGLSEDIIRRVQKAQSDVAIDYLLKGYKVNIPGLCTIRPELKAKLGLSCAMDSYIKATLALSSVISSEIEGHSEFERPAEEEEELIKEVPRDVISLQIPSLS